ncbi:MAG: glycosyltransferase [Myxococcales bacterium]|nr:glycosyltransferase [Myxococcales bacterium]
MGSDRSQGPDDGRSVVILTRTLKFGGAERQIVLTARGLAARGARVTVATFYPGGELEADLRDAPGVEVVSLDKRSRWDLVGFILRLRRLARRGRPDVVYGVLFGPAWFATIACLGTGVRRVWGLRGSSDAGVIDTRERRLIYRVTAWLSRFPHAILVNSERGRRDYIAMGLRADRFHVIPNGFDVERWRPDPEAGAKLRERWNVGSETRVLGLVGRVHPVKGHALLLDAAARLLPTGIDFRVAFVGPDRSGHGGPLRERAKALGIADRVLWIDATDEMRAVYNAFDVSVCASGSEGFPNVVGEAMACGRTCVTTDVGDAAILLGGTGLVVPRQDPAAMAEALRRALGWTREERERRAAAARARIVESYTIDRMIERTEAVLWPRG